MTIPEKPSSFNNLVGLLHCTGTINNNDETESRNFEQKKFFFLINQAA